MKIIMIGHYPPPIGGISIHINRLLGRLIQKNIDVNFFDDSSMSLQSYAHKIWMFLKRDKNNYPKPNAATKNYIVKNAVQMKMLRDLMHPLIFSNRKQKTIVHYHTKFWKFRALIALTSLLNPKLKILFTIHSMRDEYHEFSLLKKFYANVCLKLSAHLLVTNSIIKNKLIDWGVDEKKITVIHPFLPVIKREEDYNEIPQNIWDFIENHDPVISANGARIVFFENEDLYGLDLCVETCRRLVKDYPNTGFVFSLPLVGEEKYFASLKNKIKEYGIENNFLFITEKFAFYPILEKSTLFVRPTNTDGDALSIREALSFNIPTVTSDAVERPEGAVIFKNRDADDLYNQVVKVLKSNNSKDLNSEEAESESFNKILEIYTELSE